MLDGEAFGTQIVEIVRSYVDDVVAPLLERFAALEARQLERGEKGEPGERGVPGNDGHDGRDADPDLIAEQVAAAVAALPAPAAGQDGQNGRDADMEEIRRAIGEEVVLAVKALPPARDGQDGRDGRDGIDGKDGVGASGALIDRSGALVLTMMDGTVHHLGSVVGQDGADGLKGADGLDGGSGRDGRDGKDGRDGFGFDNLSVEHDGERGFVMRFAQADHIKEFPFRLPVVIDRGVFRAEQTYEAGDAVTWAGSLWIAKGDTSEKPGDGEAWRLAVKKGRDGKDAPPRV